MKTNKFLKYLFLGIIFLGLFFFARVVYYHYYLGHKFSWGTQFQIAWIIKNHLRDKIDSIGGTSVASDNKIYSLNLNDEFDTKISVWEIQSNIPFSKISIDTNYFYDKLELNNYETINDGSKGIIYNIDYNYDLKNYLILGLSNYSQIKKVYSGINFIGVFGKNISEIYIESNSKTNIMLENNFQMPYLAIVIYKKHDKIYIIKISGLKEFDENIIDILNLT